MKFIYKTYFLFFLFVLSVAKVTLAAGLSLAHQPFSQELAWHLKSDQGFVVSDANRVEKQKTVQDSCLSVTIKDNGFVLNNIPTLRSGLRIAPVNGCVHYGDAVHQGSLLAQCVDGIATLVLETNSPLSATQVVQVEAPVEIDQPMIEEEDEQDESQEQPTLQTADLDKRLYNVRVLLDEWQIKKDGSEKGRFSWKLASPQGFKLTNRTGAVSFERRYKPNEARQAKEIPSNELRISCGYGEVYINGKKYESDHLFIVPNKGATAFDGNHFQGAFLLARKNNTLYLINSLDLEDYVFSVLRTESWPGWPLEVNKVFAIACRSYAIAMIMRSRSNKLPYHIKNTNAHQTYTGMHECPLLKAAVEKTKGVFLTYEDKPVIAMFDGCCGGVVPAHIKGFNFTGAPYLARPYACTYCRSCKLYSWQAHYSANTLATKLKPVAPSLKKLRDIKVTKKDKAGLAQEVTLQGQRGTIRLPGKKFYSMVKGIKSFCFTVHKNDDTVTFKGRGYGHHLGLCQWGAREMVRRGWEHRDILQFYYPETSFMKLV